jgi:hypothetical protein
VLLSSGLIAGGAIGSLCILFAQEILERMRIDRDVWSLEKVSPLAASDLASFVPFFLLAGFVYLVGRRSTPAAERG